MAYFRIETIEYVPKKGYYWAFEAESKREAMTRILSGTEIPTELFTHKENNRPAINVQILEIKDVTEKVNRIIEDNRNYEQNKADNED